MKLVDDLGTCKNVMAPTHTSSWFDIFMIYFTNQTLFYTIQPRFGGTDVKKFNPIIDIHGVVHDYDCIFMSKFFTIF